jgi:hypothetical protein
VLIRETSTTFTSMLAEAGIAPVAVTGAHVRGTVEAFHRFAALPVDGVAPPEEDGDGVLAQFGMFAFRGQREFTVDLTRQLIGVGDEDTPMWHLSCAFYYPFSAETELLGSGSLWSFGKTLDEFFADAVELPGWAWALRGSETPTGLAITLAEV